MTRKSSTNFGTVFIEFYHFVNCGDDLQHLPPGDEAILVEVVHAEGPLQLVLELPPRGDAESAEKLSEVNCSVSIGVKCPEHMLGKLSRVSVREKVAVYLLELLDRELAVGTVFEEAFVPFLDLGLCELCVVS